MDEDEKVGIFGERLEAIERDLSIMDAAIRHEFPTPSFAVERAMSELMLARQHLCRVIHCFYAEGMGEELPELPAMADCLNNGYHP